jgi:hypothetical protein
MPFTFKLSKRLSLMKASLAPAAAVFAAGELQSTHVTDATPAKQLRRAGRQHTRDCDPGSPQAAAVAFIYSRRILLQSGCPEDARRDWRKGIRNNMLRRHTASARHLLLRVPAPRLTKE